MKSLLFALALMPMMACEPTEQTNCEWTAHDFYNNSKIRLIWAEKEFADHAFWQAISSFEKAEQSLNASGIDDEILEMRIKIGQIYTRLVMKKDLEVFNKEINELLDGNQ